MSISAKLFVFLWLIVGISAHEKPVVKTNNGLIRGTYKTSENGKEFTAFEGVPYATPPTGNLRFKDPKPVSPWTGMWEANNLYTCLQLLPKPSQPDEIAGVEDCLYINIYSPRINDSSSMDVIVHIHGGGFMLGAGHHWGPEIIMDKHDVVYVNFNYRLGPLGFLSTEDDVVPGNMGLKDQVLAMKWIKENIHVFGGNPNSITITGVSAGGASVHLHYMSPLSKDLFNRGISASGTALNNWAIVEKPLEKAHKLGEYVGCEQESTQELVDCLRQRNPQQIIKMMKKFKAWLNVPFTPFGPVVESKTITGKRFLTDLPYNLLKQGKVADLPWITSVNSEEGLIPASEFVLSDDHLPYLEKHWSELSPFIMSYESTASETSYEEIAKKIKDFYLHGKEISKETFTELVQAIGDKLFVVDAEKAARLQARVNKSPVYFYYFTYRGTFSFSNFFTHSKTNYGTSHGDDSIYIVYYSTDQKFIVSDEDKEMSKIMTNMWTTFAHTGVPILKNIEWPSVTKQQKEKFEYAYIAGPDKISIKKVDELGHRSFWDTLPIKENNRIVVTNENEI